MRSDHLLLLLLLLALSSCGNQRSFSGDARFAKRQHLKGWHLDLGAHHEDRQGAPAPLPAVRRVVVKAHANPDPEPLSFAGPADPQAFSLQVEAPAGPRAPAEGRHGSLVSGRATTGPQLPAPRTVQDEPEPPRKWNWFALVSPVLLVVALVLAIPAESTELLLLGCLVALAFAYVGARQIRDREERGAGFAMITLGLAAAGVFIALLALLMRL